MNSHLVTKKIRKPIALQYCSLALVLTTAAHWPY